MKATQQQIERTILSFNDNKDSQLQNSEEAHAYCAAIQFYLGNQYEVNDNESNFNDGISDAQSMITYDQNALNEVPERNTMKLNINQAMKVLAYGQQ